jgi:hypothetical protein
MANGHTIILRGPEQRERAKRLIDVAPLDTVVKFAPMTRTNAQNDMMWAQLSVLSRLRPEQRIHAPHVWKALVMDMAGNKPIWVPALQSDGMVCIGYKSSRLTKAEMSDVIEAAYAYAAEHGIDLDN